jgi:hypothetical protein
MFPFINVVAREKEKSKGDFTLGKRIKQNIK